MVYEVHCAVCRSQEETLDYIYVGQTSESCYVRGAEHLDAMKAGLRDEPDKSHMATHVITTHGGVASEAKFMMKKIKSYPSTFLRILAECIRIKNRSREKGVVVLNSKSGDFGSYSLPRLSVESHGQEREPQAPAQSDLQTGEERREPRRVDVPILNARKGKIKCKRKI